MVQLGHEPRHSGPGVSTFNHQAILSPDEVWILVKFFFNLKYVAYTKEYLISSILIYNT